MWSVKPLLHGHFNLSSCRKRELLLLWEGITSFEKCYLESVSVFFWSTSLLLMAFLNYLNGICGQNNMPRVCPQLLHLNFKLCSKKFDEIVSLYSECQILVVVDAVVDRQKQIYRQQTSLLCFAGINSVALADVTSITWICSINYEMAELWISSLYKCLRTQSWTICMTARDTVLCGTVATGENSHRAWCWAHPSSQQVLFGFSCTFIEALLCNS